ncbi:P-loop containing nucleoside triphosphate hydrolase protein [Mycena rebaudengoi]|nr:P-loop containing nucleoside triphosphate hydrolase protein [Mycena rebaudengoi]
MSTPPTAAAPLPSTAIFPDRLANLILTSKTIVAAAELLPFPYVKCALGPVIPILEAVQKMTKNREDLTELCASIVELITLLQEEISCHGADAASRLTQFCEQLKSLLLEIQQGLGKFQNPEKRSFCGRFKEFGRSTSIGDELNKYKSRVHELRLNFITSSVAQLNIHARGPTTQPPPPPITIGCPPPSRIFQGQRDILGEMHHYFAQDIGKRHVCLLHGLGGSGKTQIALKFLDECPNTRFTDVFFLDASTAETIRAGLKNIALTRSLGSDHEAASYWLASCRDEWLLFFDNADDPKLNLFNFLPQSSYGNILITSRNPQLRVYAPGAHHRISDLEEEAAVQLLLASATEPATSENEVLAINIVKVLHCFPLAVVQAGAYILKRGALRRYLALYEQNQARLLGEVPAQSHDKYAWFMYTTWDISFKCLSKLATRFLQLCSFLHHEGISEAIFSKAAIYTPYILGPTLEQVKEPQEFLSQFCTSAGMWDTLSFADMVSEIQEYSLINQDPNTSFFSIHPLADPQLATQFLYPYQKIYHYSGNYQQAQELCEDLLGQAKSTLGVEHPKTLVVMANLAAIYRRLGRLAEAEEHEVVVLEKRKKLLGSEHPDTLTAMENLGATCLGKLTDAEELELLGPEHPDTLNAMANIGVTYQGLGKLTDAKELQVVVLEKRKKLLGPDHPDTLTAMANLGAIYWGLGKLTDAEELEEVVLEKSRQTLGPEHPHTLNAMRHLAATRHSLEKFREAEQLLQTVVEVRTQLLGTTHPKTVSAQNYLLHCKNLAENTASK